MSMSSRRRILYKAFQILLSASSLIFHHTVIRLLNRNRSKLQTVQLDSNNPFSVEISHDMSQFYLTLFTIFTFLLTNASDAQIIERSAPRVINDYAEVDNRSQTLPASSAYALEATKTVSTLVSLANKESFPQKEDPEENSGYKQKSELTEGSSTNSESDGRDSDRKEFGELESPSTYGNNYAMSCLGDRESTNNCQRYYGYFLTVVAS